MLNKSSVRKSQPTDTPKLRGRNGEIELQPIEKGAVVPTGNRERETPSRERDSERPGMLTREDNSRERLFKFIDKHGLLETLEWCAEYAECERNEIAKSDQPLRVYWRKLQNFITECAAKVEKVRVNRNRGE